MKSIIIFLLIAFFSFFAHCASDSTNMKNPVAVKFNISKLIGNEYATSIEIPLGKNILTELEISYFKGSDNSFLSEFSRRGLNTTNFHHSGWAGMLEFKKVRRIHRIINSNYGFALHYKDVSFPSQWLDFGRPLGGDGNEWDEINISQQKKCYDVTFRIGSNFLIKYLRMDFYYGAGLRYTQTETSYYGYYFMEEKTNQYVETVPNNKKLFRESANKFYPIFNLGMKIGLAF